MTNPATRPHGATVNHIKDAKAGDTVWLYEAERNRYDENKKYVGRGVWRLANVVSTTRQSVKLDGESFDIETGAGRPRNGYTSGNRIGGQVEKDDWVWLNENRRALSDSVARSNDVERLRRVKAILEGEG